MISDPSKVSISHPPAASATHLSPFKGRLLFLLAFILFTFESQPLAAQEATTFILVRHAEKADDGTNDPPLNKMGKKRASNLANNLKETGITAIYSTPYKRTMQTVQPIAKAKGLKISSYNPGDSSVLDKIMETEAGGTVLIAGHSNTTPMLVNQLIGRNQFGQLDESDYDNLFIVMVEEIGNGKALKLTF